MQDGNPLRLASMRHCQFSIPIKRWILTKRSKFPTSHAIWSDILPNPWQAARIADQLITHLKATGDTDADIYDQRAYLAHLLREHVKDEVEKQAEGIFHEKLRQGEIRFDLEVGEPKFRMKHHYEIQVSSDDRPLLRNYQPVQLTLFEPVFEREFANELEKKFACYLDEQRAVQWWHRVAVRQQGEYYLQGWKKGRIYPDFVAMANEERLLIFETKGEHLSGNPDTEYKQKVLKALEGGVQRRRHDEIGRITQ